jgi:predicted RNA-binding protein with PUA-like domain
MPLNAANALLYNVTSERVGNAAIIDQTPFPFQWCPVTAVPEPGPLMTYFLAKTEPSTYSIGDLERDHKTVWDGVTNPQAVRAIKDMQPGDRVFFYHSGGESAIVGLAMVRTAGRPDPKNPKSAIADFEFLTRLEPPTTLAEIKASKKFEDWALVRQSRLSTMQAPEKFVDWMRKKYPTAKI